MEKITSAKIIELGVGKYVNEDDGKPRLTRAEFDAYDADARVAAIKAVRDGRLRFID
jgi:hypothetical protein